ncbi:MAG: MarR family winged helix-turn-helix transcriptional regulator [Calditrichia bacterium]
MQDLIDRLIAEWEEERPELNTDAMAVVGRIILLGNLLEKRASAALKPFGMHYTDLDVLATLRRSGAPYRLTPTELLGSVLLTSGAMTTLLNRLEKAGHITREPDPNDGRIKAVKLTAEGKALIDQAIKVRFQEATGSITELSSAESRQFEALLKKLMSALTKSE